MEYEDKIEYSTLEEYKREVDFWYRRYNISRERVELFHDFLITLYELIDETYLGQDIEYDYADIELHFKWCWNKVISNFALEKIHFKENGPYYDYLFGFFHDGYYNKVNKNEKSDLLNIFAILFQEKILKTQTELEIFTDICQLFNLALKK